MTMTLVGDTRAVAVRFSAVTNSYFVPVESVTTVPVAAPGNCVWLTTLARLTVTATLAVPPCPSLRVTVNLSTLAAVLAFAAFAAAHAAAVGVYVKVPVALSYAIDPFVVLVGAHEGAQRRAVGSRSKGLLRCGTSLTG
jgi:hypothetical protein